MKILNKTIKSILTFFGIAPIRHSQYKRIMENNRQLLNDKNDIDFLQNIEKNKLKVLDFIKLSKSQIRQDLFVLSELDFKKDGFFVEFGATNGLDLSNSYLLEKEFNWNGILAEPAKVWHTELKQNRNCNIETDCIWTKSGEIIEFQEVENAELSKIKNIDYSDANSIYRNSNRTYKVKTISLNDLLLKYNAPRQIDYLSIDTEGSEFDILSELDFEKYDIKIITSEHNFTNQREKIFNLLTSKGYKRKYETISKYDDWYIKED
jgi:FkbM family methyltransferase